MIILTSQDIQYCNNNEKFLCQNSKSNHYVSYQKLSFQIVASFASHQLSEAIAKSREFLDLDLPVCAIVVKEAERITVWREAI